MKVNGYNVIVDPESLPNYAAEDEGADMLLYLEGSKSYQHGMIASLIREVIRNNYPRYDSTLAVLQFKVLPRRNQWGDTFIATVRYHGRYLCTMGGHHGDNGHIEWRTYMD